MGDIDSQGFQARLSRTVRRDLFLAIACEEKVPGAWEIFQKTYEAGLRARASGQDGAARTVSDGLLADLYQPRVSGTSRTRLGSYDGSGPLGAWLHTVLRHGATDERRRRASESRRHREAGMRSSATGSDLTTDPVAVVSAQELRDKFEQALYHGWECLSPRESLAVIWKFRDGKAQVEIAQLLGVGKPRVSRIVQNGIRKLRSVVTRDLAVEDDADLALAWQTLRDCAALHLAARPEGEEPPITEPIEEPSLPGTAS
jgi:RNA polymerase sigma factor (sigma-70 family)